MGLSIFLLGMYINIRSDYTMMAIKKKKGPGYHIPNSFLYKYLSAPNYFGEIVLWAGLTIICIPYMSGFQYVALISPVFAFLLIYFVSGVRMLEDKANKKWGKDSQYQKYKKNTPIFVPKL